MAFEVWFESALQGLPTRKQPWVPSRTLYTPHTSSQLITPTTNSLKSYNGDPTPIENKTNPSESLVRKWERLPFALCVRKQHFCTLQRVYGPCLPSSPIGDTFANLGGDRKGLRLLQVQVAMLNGLELMQPDFATIFRWKLNLNNRNNQRQHE